MATKKTKIKKHNKPQFPITLQEHDQFILVKLNEAKKTYSISTYVHGFPVDMFLDAINELMERAGGELYSMILGEAINER